MATNSELTQQMNSLTLLVNSIIENSSDISSFQLLSPLEDTGELAVSYNGENYKINIGQLSNLYLNVTAVGQSTGANTAQTLTTTPTSITAYLNNAFELNTTVTHTGTTNLTTQISPASIGASGYYRISFTLSLTSAASALYTFEVYKNGVSTGLLCVVDLRNNNVDAVSASINTITQTVLLDTDTVEIYGYADGGTNAVTYTIASLNIERIGNV